MRFERVDRQNIEILYNLNRELAVCEGQIDLFVADKSEYFRAFCDEMPLAKAYLIYKGNTTVGFFIYFEKFATYLAKKTLFLEDLYIREALKTKDNISCVFEFIKRLANSTDSQRVEMRVLKRYGLKRDILESLNFKRVDKWDVYRYEN